MTTPAGTIAASNINTEFGRAGGSAVSMNNSSVRALGGDVSVRGIANSGTSFSMNSLRSKSKTKSAQVYVAAAATRSTGVENTNWSLSWPYASIGNPGYDWVSDSLDLWFPCHDKYLNINWTGGCSTYMYFSAMGYTSDYRGDAFSFESYWQGNTLGVGYPQNPSNYYAGPVYPAVGIPTSWSACNFNYTCVDGTVAWYQGDYLQGDNGSGKYNLFSMAIGYYDYGYSNLIQIDLSQTYIIRYCDVPSP